MTQQAPNSPDLEIRAPRAGEEPRAAYLFRNAGLPPQAYVLVAVKSRPIERFVAAVGWWLEDNIARFRLVFQPGVPRAEMGVSLLHRVEEAARASGADRLYYADLMADPNDLTILLKDNGLELIRSERFFEIAREQALTRVEQMFGKYSKEIPNAWRTEAIRNHPPEIVFDLVLAHRLLPPAEMRKYWQVNAQLGFSLDLSCVLFDGPRAFGTLLIREVGDALHYDVRVVHETNPRLRALGNLLLFRHNSRRADENPHIRWLYFRGGESEHRETANLAFRMGGRELPPRHVFGKKL